MAVANYDCIGVMKIQKGLLIFSFALFLQACATKSNSTNPVVTPLATEAKPETTAEPKPALSPQLFALLKTSGVPVKKIDYAEVIKAFDVYCKVLMPNGNRTCTFKSGSTKYIVPSKSSELLADLLFELNISQGDSGVATSYIECRKYSATDFSCDVAMPLDFQKP